MTASSQTFIGSVLKKVGLSEYLRASDAKYPTLNPSQTPDASTFYLFSSEPFPFSFERYMGDLERIGFNGGLLTESFLGSAAEVIGC